MSKLINSVLIIALIISIGYNCYLFKQFQSINVELEEIQNKKIELETSLTEKEELINEKSATIDKLEQNVSDLHTEVDLLKEQLLNVETEITELELQKELIETEQKQSENKENTVGGTGQTKQPETNPEYTPSSEPNQMDPNEAFGKFGAEFIGSGGGQPKTGSGGYGITLQ